MSSVVTTVAAPEFRVANWLNASRPVSLARLRGKVVAVYAFQMLCPGCVSHAIPQAKQVRHTFPREDVEVLGLHTVFEHHVAMGRAALEAFIHEYRIDFPVGIDQPSDNGPVPLTMQQYQLRGTPTLLLFDRQGVLRHSILGKVHDMQVGALLAGLVAETIAQPQHPHCNDGACRI
ncbi:peroxiredoxin family protein [Massilia pseudoviolaceinigra]|uniref:peroxiredoxin family protein n=1 Tax=Massilia pseudoviolaceinigra TaxID=3057165 RepID=UPI002796C762|nr:redoxin domain-containing protein [Massilia sp. CCM 9206]MDQ1924771.1 redoxin domain-containing protein [Massilia sp. CCM 9206]